MDTSTMQLADSMSTLIWTLVYLITIGGGIAAFTKRAPLLGAGLLMSGLFGGVRMIFFRALPLLTVEMYPENWMVINAWIRMPFAFIELVSMVLVLVGVIKLARR